MVTKIFFYALVPFILIASARYQTIENFDSGVVNLHSYPGQDIHPTRWQLDSIITYHNSAYSLKLFGNTWKAESINNIVIDTNQVWQVSAYIDALGEIQGFGLQDSAHTLFYSLAGTEQLNIQEWVTVYQGAYTQDTWHTYQLPVGQDWFNWFGYLPTVTSIIFINDRDTDTSAIVYFDEIIDITEDLPIAPQVVIWDSIGQILIDQYGNRNVTVQFYSLVIDPDSDNHEYFWSFGDSTTSNDSCPIHTYLVTDDHEYTVLLRIRDSTNLWAYATCQVNLDSGQSTLPVTINFVGDIMLARRYEQIGGLINTFGVETIFTPTLPYLGNNAQITVANLESPLTNQGTPHPTKPIIFRSHPDNVRGLDYAGIDLVTLANNHILDYGLPGIVQTQQVLDSVNILHSGAGANLYQANLPVFVNKNGINIGFLAYSDRTGQYNNYQPYLNAGYAKPGFANLDTFTVAQALEQINPIADLKIVQFHSGIEYTLTPVPLNSDNRDNQDEFYSAQCLVPCTSDVLVRRHAIDAGTDLVINHHPHMIQGFEVYKDKLIAHSLGDFTFDLDYPETYPSVILNAKIDRQGLYDYYIIPIYIDNYIPQRARGALGLHILNHLAQYSRNMNTYLLVNRDSVTAAIILDTQNLVPVINNYQTQLQLKVQDSFWISAPFALNQNGNISKIASITPSRNWQYRVGRPLKWLWCGNFEDEGSTLWLLNQVDEYYDTIAYQGRRSLCQKRNRLSSQITTNLEQRIVCYADTSQYTIYGNLKTQNANNAGISANFYASRTGGMLLGQASLDTLLSGTSDWQYLYRDFTPMLNTKYIDVVMTSQGPLTGTAYTWFDDVGIIEWEPWRSFNNPVNIITPNDYYWIQVRSDQMALNAYLNYQETEYSIVSSVNENTVNKIKMPALQIFPNPTKSQSVINYNLSQSSKVILKIYNSIGQEVKTLHCGIQTQGFHTITWDGKDNLNRLLPKGIYFCHLQINNQNQSRKIILLN